MFRTFAEMEQMLEELQIVRASISCLLSSASERRYWDPYARASITGMNRGTHKAHIIRAALESIAYQVRDAVSAYGK